MLKIEIDDGKGKFGMSGSLEEISTDVILIINMVYRKLRDEDKELFKELVQYMVLNPDSGVFFSKEELEKLEKKVEDIKLKMAKEKCNELFDCLERMVKEREVSEDSDEE